METVDKQVLVTIRREGKVLLGKMKRGVGKDKWNGFGGKMEEEGKGDARAALFREVKAEIGRDS